MLYRDFAQVFIARPCFTARDVALRFAGFHDRQLHYWQTKGLVRLLRRPYYRLTDRPWTLHDRWAVANMLYGPSYISLDSALSYHGFIPEGVFHITSVATRHTRTFDVDSTRYFYRNVRPAWFFGYTLLEQDGVAVRMAGPEKTVLDTLHFGNRLRDADDFDAMRFDAPGILAAIDPQTWEDLLILSNNKALMRRARAFQRWLHDHAR
jgi:hypothetical protein